jgi:hypothetical protein
MKSTIEFNYHNYAQIDDMVSFWLVVYDDDENMVLDKEIGILRIPKELVKFKESTSLYPEIAKAISLAQVFFNNYSSE